MGSMLRAGRQASGGRCASLGETKRSVVSLLDLFCCEMLRLLASTCASVCYVSPLIRVLEMCQSSAC